MSIPIHLLEKSFAQIQPQAAAFSQNFHQHLFADNPDVEAMFADLSLELMEKKLMASLALIVENLHNPDALAHALLSLGAYHVTKGTVKEHYPLVGKALLLSFQDFLGDDWTPTVAKAWKEAFHLIANIMMEGGDNAEDYLNGQLTFYEWLDLYGESSPTLRKLVESSTHFKYGYQ
jgi:hemoglobin-like flavoprotein